MRIKELMALLVILILSVLPAAAEQDQFKKVFRDLENEISIFNRNGDDQEQDFDKFRQTQETAFQAFRDERDRDFSAFLKAEWEVFTEMKELVRYTTPKPKIIPKASKIPDDDSIIPKGKRVKPVEPLSKTLPEAIPQPELFPVTDPVPKAEMELVTPVPVTQSVPIQPLPPVLPEPQNVPQLPPVPSPESEPRTEPQPQLHGTVVEVMFYGLPVKVACDPALTARVANNINNQVISNYWATLSQTDFEDLIRQLANIKWRLLLNDWGFFQFVERVAKTIQPDTNSATLLAWFLLTKSDYQIKVGYSHNHIYLLAPARDTIYKTPYYTINGKRFYNISYLSDQRKSGKIYTFKKDYPGAESVMTLVLRTTPRIHADKTVKNLNFRYNDQTYNVPVAFNPNTIRFYQAYPQTIWEIYLSAPIAPETETSLVNAMSKLIEGKSETEAVNMLLRFVQTAFKYQTDDDQFGYEKYMFVEETLSSRYSDCEDRATLFSSLVRRITDLEVIGLFYPGHAATAVKFSEYVTGDAVRVSGERFVVCDPSYVNANIGVTMPQFKKIKPQVVRSAL